MHAKFFIPLICTLAAVAANPGSIRGTAADPGGAVIRDASVRIVPEVPVPSPVTTLSDENGIFIFQAVAPGELSIGVRATGFREKLVRGIIVKSGESIDVGTVRLELSGCDAPMVNCDYVFPAGEVPRFRKTEIFREFLKLPRGCDADLENSRARCPDDTPAASSRRRVDLSLQNRQGGEIWLQPLNGAKISEANSANPECSNAQFQSTPVRIDGRGPGQDFCVRTRAGFRAHVFLTDYVAPNSTEVTLWHVTRK